MANTLQLLTAKKVAVKMRLLSSIEPSSWQNPRLTSRIVELDGIRGLAILLVLVWHYIVCIVHPVAGSPQAYVLRPLQLTWSGVDLFFVLSGFLIGGILYDARHTQAYYQTFFLRRFHRILPPYFIWLSIFFVGLYLTGPSGPKPLIQLFNRVVPIWSYPLFTQNVFMSLHSSFGPDWMGHTWSLAVEEQFYLLLPLTIRRLSSKTVVRLTTGAILFAPALRVILWIVGNTAKARYTLLPCRADALGFGVLIALACRNQDTWTYIAGHFRYLYSAQFRADCSGRWVLLLDVALWRTIDGYCRLHVDCGLLCFVVVDRDR